MTTVDYKCPCGAELHVKSLWAAICAEAYKAFAAVHDPHSTPTLKPVPPAIVRDPRGKNAFGYSGGKGYAH